MPKPTKGPRLGGGPAHERLLLANLATALITHKSITTTETKAKRLRPLAERLITFAKRGDLHARRRVMTVIRDKNAVHELFTEIAPLVAEREGGYTRITKTGFRKGDNAPMAVIELVLEPVTPKAQRARPAAAAPATGEIIAHSAEVPIEDALEQQTPVADEAVASDAEVPTTAAPHTDSVEVPEADAAEQAVEVADDLDDDMPAEDDAPRA